MEGKLDSLQIAKLDPIALYRKGFTAVVANRAMPNHPLGNQLRILPPGGRASENVLPGESADLRLYRGDLLVGVVVNGRYWKVE